jgi:hypothetical protein
MSVFVNRKKDIEEYLEYTHEKVRSLSIKYASTDFAHVNSIDKPEVYNCVCQLRSVLEYCYQDIIERFIVPTITPSDISIKRELGRRVYFPYSSANHVKFMSSHVIQRLFAVNRPMFDLIEKCQQYLNLDKTFYNICAFSNPIKHDKSSQETLVIKSILVGNEIICDDSMIIDYSTNMILEGANLQGSGILISGCSRITISNFHVARIRIQDSQNIKVFGSSFDSLVMGNSSALIFNNLILKIQQRQAINANGSAYKKEEGETMTVGAVSGQVNEEDTFPIAIVDQNQIVIAGGDVRIINLLNNGYVQIRRFIDEIYSHF